MPSNTQPESGAIAEQCLIFTPAGSFKVDGSVHDVQARLAAEEWPLFALSESRETLLLRSSEVSAVQSLGGNRRQLGFRPKA